MRLKTLANINNLRLAWRRITTGTNTQYKRHFRGLYHAYELCADDHLRDLRERVLNGSFTPSPPERVYMPKPSGLHRPLTLLGIEDQIILQALANIAVTSIAKRRTPLQLKSIFSNIVESPTSEFFFRKWQDTHKSFKKKATANFAAGMNWVADFDLAAYYDTIAHDLLLTTIFPKFDGTDREWLLKCLSTWTSVQRGGNHAHGLPQGPLASDFLSECFLLPIDSTLHGKGYIRYVDDIRLMGHSENEVRERVIELEKECLERGLIPQSGKFSIKKAATADEAAGMLPSIADPHHLDHDNPNELLAAKKAEEIFKKSLRGKPLRIKEKTFARYSLYRAEPKGPLVRRALNLVPHHPEHTDAFFTFFARCGPQTRVLRVCEQLIKTSPYAYVRGESWQLMAAGLESGTLSEPSLSAAVNTATTLAKNQKADFYERMGATQFLLKLPLLKGKSVNTRIKPLLSQPPLARALLAGMLPINSLQSKDLCEHYLCKDTTIEPGLALSVRLREAGISLPTLSMPPAQLKMQTRKTLAALALVTSKHGKGKADPVGELLHSRYASPSDALWRKFLGDRYSHGAGLLKLAESAFLSSPSTWLQHQNSFNQIIYLALQDILSAPPGHPGAITVVGKNGEMVDFGVTLDANNGFSKNYPKIADCFRLMNQRRNKLPPSHPYDKKTGAKTKLLNKQERNRFVKQMKEAYAELAKFAI